MFTSEHLEQGKVYTRHDLRQLFNITAATLNNGVFKPSNHNSVWLFVTENKSSNMTAYKDRLLGNTLQWDGQLTGRTDKLIIEHARSRLELLLFYRKSNTEFPGSGFRYEGRFRYKSHSGANPTHFILERIV